MNIFNQETNNRIVIILIICMAILMNGFYYVNWDVQLWRMIIKLVGLVFAGVFFFNKDAYSECNFRGLVLFLALFPFLSIFSANIIYGQSMTESFSALLPMFVWFSYFILHKYNISEGEILKALFVVSVIVLVIQVFQQISFPSAWFGTIKEGTIDQYGRTVEISVRNGLYRFRLGNCFHTVIILFFLIESYQYEKSRTKLLIICLLLGSIYLTLTRQLIAGSLIVILFSYLVGTGKMGGKAILSLFIILFGVYISYDFLFASLFGEDADAEQNLSVRMLASELYWDKSKESILGFLLGNGEPAGAGRLTDLTYQWEQIQGLFVVDVGIIGSIFRRGFIYTLGFFYLCYLILSKYKDFVPEYCKMFIMFTIVICMMIFPYTSPLYYLIFSMILYICDLHINETSGNQYYENE